MRTTATGRTRGRPRKDRPPEPMPPRPAPLPTRGSSIAVLARHVGDVAAAYNAGDEPATREALNALAAEARLLATIAPLMPSPLNQRLRISAERSRSGRAA